jgi:hypothetical protein
MTGFLTGAIKAFLTGATAGFLATAFLAGAFFTGFFFGSVTLNALVANRPSKRVAHGYGYWRVRVIES